MKKARQRASFNLIVKMKLDDLSFIIKRGEITLDD